MANNTNQKFKQGDVVKLKSGSPVMTVKCYEPPDGTDVTCSWFWKDEIQEKSFPEDMLVIHKRTDPFENSKNYLKIMDKKKFKPGEVVQLNSGGPEMTVKGYDPADGNEVTCTWFWRDQIQEKSFPEEVLALYEPFDFGDFGI